jgi:hypothetical protein
MARNNRAAWQLEQDGAKAEMADALLANEVHVAVQRSAPEVIVNQLTALPQQYNPDSIQPRFHAGGDADRPATAPRGRSQSADRSGNDRRSTVHFAIERILV